VRYVVGRLEGPLELAEGERVIFAGDCTRWEGRIDGESVSIEDSYVRHCDKGVAKTQSNDMLLKIMGALWLCLRRRSSRHIQVKGCPVSVAQHVSYLSSLGKIPNPNFDPRMVVPVNIAYWQMRFNRFLNRILD